MTFFRENEHPLACIFGIELEGNRHKENKPINNWIAIHWFKCEVSECSDSNCERNAHEKYGHFELRGDLGDTVAGRRGIVEPKDGCNSPGFITKGKHRKVTNHNPPFSVCGMPAVCYYNNLHTMEAIKLKEVKYKKK